MDDRIQRVLEYVQSNLSSILTLQELARVALMSQGHFHKIFKKETGLTPFKYIEGLKMKEAYSMLLSGAITINELTNQFGYNDYETFSRTFKKYYALSPDDLRAVAQQIKKDLNIEGENLIFKKYEIENLDQFQEELEKIKRKMKKILIEKGYSEKDLEEARMFPVLPISAGSLSESKLVKNKFLISEHPVLKNKN